MFFFSYSPLTEPSLFRIPFIESSPISYSHRNTTPLTKPSLILYSPFGEPFSFYETFLFTPQPISSYSHRKPFTFSLSSEAIHSLTANPSSHSHRKPLFSLSLENPFSQSHRKASSLSLVLGLTANHLTLLTAIFGHHYRRNLWFVVAIGYARVDG
ncbi:hypothetical protein ACSQ67_003043 [Phaseolus vulgaris]